MSGEDATGTSSGFGYPRSIGLPLPSLGHLQNLTVVSTSNTSSSYPITIQVFVNRIATSLTCTITIAPTSIPCSDNVNTVSVNAGDVIAVQMSTPTVLDSGLSIHVSLEKQ